MSTLRGSLQSISLMDVVQLLGANRKTGKLLVTQGAATGTLYVLNGDVVHAESPEARGESAAFEILEWDRGEFEFVSTKFKAPNTIHRSVPDLLMEAARTSDSRRHLRAIFPSLNVVPWPTLQEPRLTEGLRIFQEDRRCLPFLDGYRTFQEVIAVSEQSEVSVLQACAQLKQAGRLKLLEPDAALRATALKGGIFRRSDHVELAASHEARWKTLGPYGAIARVRILWPEGPAVEQVRFVRDMDDRSIGIPKELMQLWGLPERMDVTVRPAP
ncbi:DUF4388 domain-containing protein [Mesoterricola sediminis]|uniref:PatA-like N-terminal domain-containing protein n=1 Tax=Mesoterricola sediminis TaxID=2927980 RepID=A0AA48KC32_9BACT|nr:DUF4388 domain-containing protein [Mesoterricola sediminis]BDU76581.1 hypothetical protein METESE_15390 [Mesoterricola sediminis]